MRISQSSLPCCNIPKTEWLKEDITGRCVWVWVCADAHVCAEHVNLVDLAYTSVSMLGFLAL